MKKMISEILREASQMENRKERIAFLRAHDSHALKAVLQSVYHPGVKFLLPESDPPFKAQHKNFAHETLYYEARKLYLFVEGGNPNLKQFRREQLFIQFLESIHPDDADMMLQVKNKKLPWKGITEAVVREAFPGILPEKEEPKKKDVQDSQVS